VSAGTYGPALPAEAGRVAAFVRRDLMILLSHRAGFAADLLRLCAHVLLFGLIGRLVDPALLPSYGGEPTGYLEFVAVGVLLSLVFGLLLERAAAAIRTEQTAGTLEALLVTPLRTFTLQAGSVAFDALQVPLRMGLFLALIAVAAGLELEASGTLPSIAVLCAFLPFVWGLGLIGAGAIVTFRRGTAVTAIAGMALGLASGAYFPLTLVPDRLATILSWNPMAITLEAMRDALIGGEGWDAIGPEVLVMVPMSVLTLVVGGVACGAALARERRRGTLGIC
jgi:ABC-2 type transport system permease protein